MAKQPTDRYPSTVEMAAAARRAVTQPAGRLDTAGATQPAPLITSPGVAAEANSAHTQSWPARGGGVPNPPAQFGGPVLPPPMPPPSPIGRAPRRRPGVVIGAVAAVALLVAAGVYAAVNFTGDVGPTPAAPSSTSTAASIAVAAPNTGPFTGIYRADFGRASKLDGVGDPGATPSTGSYGLRSVCRPAGCVATASKFSGDPSFAATMVFDQVGASWVAVALAPSQCKTGQTEAWQVFTLQPRPDGTLAGEHIRATADQCAEKRSVTFTRTGDVDADLTGPPDPANLPPRVVSPAEALHGRYTITRTFTGRVSQPLGDSAVTTYCLRTGDRCMSYFSLASGDIPLVFGDGSWHWNDESDGPCPNGDMSHLTASGQYPLPQPPQDPIPVLTGHGSWVQSGSCAVNFGFDETFTRTGD